MGPSAKAVSTGHGGNFPDPAATTPGAPGTNADNSYNGVATQLTTPGVSEYNGAAAAPTAVPGTGAYSSYNGYGTQDSPSQPTPPPGVQAQMPAPGQPVPGVPVTGVPATGRASQPLGISQVLVPGPDTYVCNVGPPGEDQPEGSQGFGHAAPLTPAEASPDCATTLTLTVQPGELQVQVPQAWPLGTFPVGAALNDVNVKAPPPVPGEDGFVVDDTRGLGNASNWSVYVNLAAGQTGLAGPTDAPVIPVLYFPGPAESTVEDSVEPDVTDSAPIELNGTPQRVLTGIGAPGITTWQPTIRLTAPALEYRGTYTATLSTSVVEAPTS